MHLLEREPVRKDKEVQTKECQFKSQRQMIDEAVKPGLRGMHLNVFNGKKASIQELANEYGFIFRNGRIGQRCEFESMREQWSRP